MATKATSSDYWISPSALAITLNALGDPDYVQASASSGAVVLCYIRGIDGLGYDNGHNYRRWQLNASPTYFTSTTEKWLYVAIPRPTNTADSTAHIVYPSEEVDIYGVSVADSTTQVGNVGYYYIDLGARITASVIEGVRQSKRNWLNGQGPVFGLLSTDEAIAADDTEWYKYDSIAKSVTFLKPLIQLVTNPIENIKSWWESLIVDALYINHEKVKKITDVARKGDAVASPTETLVTVDYASSQYLSKVETDTAAQTITFNQGIVTQTTDTSSQIEIGSEEKTTDYQAGDIVGTGFKLGRYDNGTDTYLEVDRMLVRKKATFTELVIKKISAIGGSFFMSAASADNIVKVQGFTADGVETDDDAATDYYRLWWLQSDGNGNTNTNDFVLNDLVRCQSFKQAPNLQQQTEGGGEDRAQISNSYYWRRVLAAGSEPITVEAGVEQWNYVDLSNRQTTMATLDDPQADAGSTPPQVGDCIVLCGHFVAPGTTDTEGAARQNIIELSAYGDGTPRITLYRGVWTFSFAEAYCTKTANISPDGIVFNADSFSFTTADNQQQTFNDLVKQIADLENDTTSGLVIFKGETADRPLPHTDENGEFVAGTEGEPSSDWTDEERADYVDRAYYVTLHSEVFRWSVSDTGTYYWDMVTDRYLIDAITKIEESKAFATLTRLNQLKELVKQMVTEHTDLMNDMIATILNDEEAEYNDIVSSCSAMAEVSGDVESLVSDLELAYNNMVQHINPHSTSGDNDTISQTIATQWAGYINVYAAAKTALYTGKYASEVSFTKMQNKIATTYFVYDAGSETATVTEGGLVTESNYATLYARAITDDGTATSETIAQLGALVKWDAALNKWVSNVFVKADMVDISTKVFNLDTEHLTIDSDVLHLWKEDGNDKLTINTDNFKLDENGKATFSGSIRTLFVKSNDATTYDNLLGPDGQETFSVVLPTAPEHAGRTVRIYTAPLQTRAASGTSCTITTENDSVIQGPMNFATYNGNLIINCVFPKSIYIHGGIIELLAVGNGVTDCEWYVLTSPSVFQELTYTNGSSSRSFNYGQEITT